MNGPSSCEYATNVKVQHYRLHLLMETSDKPTRAGTSCLANTPRAAGTPMTGDEGRLDGPLSGGR